MSHSEVFPLDASYYTQVEDASVTMSNVIEVPMRNSDEIVTVDLENDLPEDYTDLTTFLENEAADYSFWIAIASAYSKKKLMQESFEVAQRGLSFFSNTEQAALFHTFLAWLYIRQSRVTITEDETKSALKLASESARSALSLHKDNVIARLAQAEIFYQQKTYDQALDIYERISKQGTKADLEVYAMIGKAKIYFKKKNFSASLKQFQAVFIIKPLVKPDPRIGVGLNFWKLKDKNLAVKAWKRALELDPKNESATLLLLLSKFDSSFSSLSDEEFTKSYSAALDSLNTLLKDDSKNPVSLLLLASYYYSKNERNTVVKIAEKVLAISSASSNLISDAHFWIARVHYENKDYSNAQRHFTESLKSNKDNLLAKLGVGQSQFEREAVEESIITFENIYKETEKILEVDYILGILYSLDTKNHPKAIQTLEKYVRLSKDMNEPIILNTYLTLSRLYENKDNTQALSYLSKSIELLQSQNEEVPVEVLNNLGVFHFIKGNPESAQTFFKSAYESNKSEEIRISLLFNNARAQESSNTEDSIAKYNEIIENVPNYVYSKIRLLFLDVIKADVKNDEDLEKKMKELVESYPKDLEVRAFYSWYLKKNNKPSNQNVESTHNKETLVKYDSHDTYALISLGNLYCSIAREIKGKTPQDVEKRNQSYVRGAQLFQKVLSVDPNNVFAAQGIAIIFVENKQSTIALETFRKIRDAIDDVSVYINLGHCLIDVGQYSKAIESYEIALRRYGDEKKDVRFLTLVGRAWFARAIAEKSLESYLKSLEYSQKSYEVVVNTGTKKLIPSLKYNVAFVQFNIAQFIQRLDVSKRTVEEIKKSLEGLKEAITAFNELAEDSFPPIQPDILKQRASMGSNTLTNQLERALKEQEQFEVNFQHKIEEAKRIKEIEKAKAEAEEKKRKEKEAQIEATKKEEYLKLQEQAKEWEKERESITVFEEDEKKSKKGRKKNAVLTDEELSGDEDRAKAKKSRNGGKRIKRKKETTEKEDEESQIKKRKINSKYKSAEFIEDSDEDLDDFDESNLGDDDDDDDDDEPDDLEQIDAKIDFEEEREENDQNKEGENEDSF